MSETALETVFDHLHARRRRDIAAVASGLDPHVVHQGVEPELVCHGREQVLERVRHSFGPRDDSGIDWLELVAAGDRVVVGLSGARFRENPLLDGHLFMVYTVRDGTITRMDDCRTRDQALRIAGAPATA
ncbi:MAG: nuclear transport factor 2 family protein [Candidatus Dormibacteria bacterium]